MPDAAANFYDARQPRRHIEDVIEPSAIIISFTFSAELIIIILPSYRICHYLPLL